MDGTKGKLNESKVNLFVKADLFNVFNQHGVENVESAPASGIGAGAGPVINKTVTVIKAFNPYTETPVLGVNYRLSPTFGQPTNKDAYQVPRTYRFAVGVRF